MTTVIVSVALPCGNFEDSLGAVNRFYMHLSIGADIKVLPLGKVEREGMERQLQSTYHWPIDCMNRNICWDIQKFYIGLLEMSVMTE